MLNKCCFLLCSNAGTFSVVEILRIDSSVCIHFHQLLTVVNGHLADGLMICMLNACRSWSVTHYIQN